MNEKDLLEIINYQHDMLYKKNELIERLLKQIHFHKNKKKKKN